MCQCMLCGAWRNRSIVEAKFVKRQGLTAQLRDGIAEAEKNNAVYYLVTAPETKLSGPLQKAIDDKLLIHETLSESAIAHAVSRV